MSKTPETATPTNQSAGGEKDLSTLSNATTTAGSDLDFGEEKIVNRRRRNALTPMMVSQIKEMLDSGELEFHF